MHLKTPEEMSIDWDTLSSVQQRQLIDYLLSTTYQDRLSSEIIPNYIEYSRQFMVKIRSQEQDLRQPIRQALAQILKHFELQHDLVGQDTKFHLHQVTISPLHLAYLMGFNILELGATKDLIKSRLENWNAVFETKLENGRPLLDATETEMGKLMLKEKERSELLHPKKQETFNYTLEILREKVANLKETHANLRIVDITKKENLVEKYEALKIKKAKLKDKLNKVSSNGSIPCSYAKTKATLIERNEYLSAIKHQISSLHDSINSSVFAD